MKESVTISPRSLPIPIVQLEAVEPIHTALAALCRTSKYLVTVDSAVVTDRQRQAIDESNSPRAAQTGAQIGRKRHQHRGQAFSQALITDQRGELRPPVA